MAEGFGACSIEMLEMAGVLVVGRQGEVTQSSQSTTEKNGRDGRSCVREAGVAFFFDELAAEFQEEAEGFEVDLRFHFCGDESGLGVNH